MKLKLILCLLLLQFYKSQGQAFYNGSFETTISTACDYNLSDITFNTKISHVTAFGKTNYGGNYIGETDIQTMGCYVTPQNRNWCVGLAAKNTTYTTSDAIALELTSNLVTGNKYQLSFYVFGNTSFSTTVAKVKIGESLMDSTFGALIDSIVPTANSWKHITLNFTASQPSHFITVKNIPGVSGWNQVDNFSISNQGINIFPDKNPILIIYPNPASDFIYVQMQNFSELKSISIKDFTGKTILITNNTTIDLSQIESGIYFIEVITDEGKYVKRILRK